MACRRKEFTPAMVKAIYDEAAAGRAAQSLHRSASRRRDPHQPRLRRRLLHEDPTTWCGPSSTASAPTAPSGANKNSIKIIGEETDNFAQGYFVYDSKKSGAMTISHLRFGPDPIRSLLPDSAGQLRRLPSILVPGTVDVLKVAEPGGTFLLNSPHGPDEVWDQPAARGASRSWPRS